MKYVRIPCSTVEGVIQNVKELCVKGARDDVIEILQQEYKLEIVEGSLEDAVKWAFGESTEEVIPLNNDFQLVIDYDFQSFVKHMDKDQLRTVFNPIATYLSAQKEMYPCFFSKAFFIKKMGAEDVSMNDVYEALKDGLLVNVFTELHGIIPYDREIINSISKDDMVIEEEFAYVPKYGLVMKYMQTEMYYFGNIEPSDVKKMDLSKLKSTN